jgi:Lon protease-like protein
MPLPLHIFEERYKELVGECLAHNREFGIVCAFSANKTIALVGCSARLKAVLNEYDDGRLDILTEGSRRFRIRHTVEEKSYAEADVEWLPDSAEVSDDKIRDKVVNSHNELLMLAFEEGSAVDMRAPVDEAYLSYALCSMLPFDLGSKQAILEAHDEEARLQRLDREYQALIERAKAVIPEVEDRPKHIM